MPEFVLPAGIETTVNHTIQLAPTDALEDPYLGSSLVVKDKDGNYSSIQTLYGRLDKDGNIKNDYQSNIYLQSVVEEVTDKDETGEVISSSKNNVFGEVINYDKTKTITNEYSYQEKTDLTKDTIPTVETTNVTYTLVGDVDDMVITGRLPVKEIDESSSTEDYAYNDEKASTYVGKDTKTSGYGTTFYIHRLAAKQEAIETTTTTKVVTEVVSQSKLTDTSITETIKTNSVENNKFELEVTKVTTVKVSENKVLKITTTTTTTTKECTLQGYVYRGYYVEKDTGKLKYITNKTFSNQYGEGVSLGVDHLTGTDGKEYDFNLHEYSVVGGTYSNETTTTNTTVENKIESNKIDNDSEINETINRTIERTYNYTDDYLNIESVSSTKTEIDATGTTTETTTYYTDGSQPEEAPLNLYDGDIQKIFLSSSYSKNYPFYVDVVFEQILN